MKLYGCPYPIVKTPKGLLGTIQNSRVIKADLFTLMTTYPGERVMMPDYGTRLRDLLFEPNDDLLAEEAREMIVEAIAKWEPRIGIDDIQINILADERASNHLSVDLNDQRALSIKIMFFDFDEIENIQTLELSLPLSSGAI